MEWRLEGLEQFEVVEPGRQGDLRRSEDLGDADGGDGEDEARGGEEPADDGGIDERPRGERGGEADAEGEEVRQAEPGDHDGGDGGREPADLGLGEVDDPGRPVDEHEAEGGEAAQPAQHDAEQHHPEGSAIGQGGAGDDPGDQCGSSQRRGTADAAPRDRQAADRWAHRHPVTPTGQVGGRGLRVGAITTTVMISATRDQHRKVAAEPPAEDGGDGFCHVIGPVGHQPVHPSAAPGGPSWAGSS